MREVWRYRGLIGLLVQRHIASRYRQMILGSLWAVLEPLAQLLLMTAVFGWLLRVDAEGYPYPIYAFAALVPWMMFSRTTMAVAGCLQENMGLISKVYFPRLVLPIAATLRELFDGFVHLALLIAVALAFGFYPGPKLLLAPLALVPVALAGTAVGLCAAAIMVKYRDLRPVLSIALQAGMYATPILYSAKLVPAGLLGVYQTNPMYWGVEAFRWLLLDRPVVATASLAVAVGGVLGLLAVGIAVFAVYEKMTVDVQ